MAVASGTAGTAQVLEGEAGGETDELEEKSGTGGHWTAGRERHREPANAALNTPVTSGKRERKENIEQIKMYSLFH